MTANKATNRPKGDQSKINGGDIGQGQSSSDKPIAAAPAKSNVQNLLDLDFGNFGGSGGFETNKPASKNEEPSKPIFDDPFGSTTTNSQNQDVNWFEADFSQLNLNQTSQPVQITQTAQNSQNQSADPQPTPIPQNNLPPNQESTTATPEVVAAQPASNSIASIMSLYSQTPAQTPSQPVQQPSTNLDIFAQLSNPVPSQKPNNLPINMANPFMAAPSPDMNPGNMFSGSQSSAFSAPQNGFQLSQQVVQQALPQAAPPASQNTAPQAQNNPFADFSSFGQTISNNNSNPFDAFAELNNSNKKENVPNALDNLQLF